MADQTTQADEVLQALQSDKTRDVLAQRWAGMYWKAQEYCALFSQEHEYYTIDTAFETVLQEEEEPEHAIDGDPPLASVTLQKRVIDKIGAPCVITFEELYDEFMSMLPRKKDDWAIGDTDTHYDAYVIRIRSLLSNKKSRLISIASAFTRSHTHGGYKQSDDEEMDHEIWSKGGVRIGCTRVGPAELDPEYRGTYHKLLYAQITGRISPGALELMSLEVKDVMRSLVRSIAVLDRPGSFVYAARTNELPPIDVDLLEGETLFLRTCLDFYLSSASSRKDTFPRRIRNAVALLASADKQERHSLGLALSVTAIEALVGEKSDNIAQHFADGLSKLLEPEMAHRDQAAAELKKIYGDRSDVLHGKQIDAQEERRGKVRLLAAGALRAVFDSWRFRLNEFDKSKAKPKDLREELSQQRFSPGLPNGVREQPAVWQLWRGES